MDLAVFIVLPNIMFIRMTLRAASIVEKRMHMDRPVCSVRYLESITYTDMVIDVFIAVKKKREKAVFLHQMEYIDIEFLL